jgi:hypothetical protein
MSNRVGQAALHESNPLGYTGRTSDQRDYYKLENRERKLKAVEYLDTDEAAFVLGNAEDAEAGGTTGEARVTAIKKALYKLHEQDIISMRALVYLQRLSDTSPEYQQLRIMTGMNTREEIADFIAEKQIKKLMMSQLEAITGGSKLTDMYKKQVSKGATSFLSLWS